MSQKYPHLLSPFKIGNVVFKNRMTASASGPHFVQGPEPYPTEALIRHFANKAKNGAALVTFGGVKPVKDYVFRNLQTIYGPEKEPLPEARIEPNAKQMPKQDEGNIVVHHTFFDPADSNVQHYLCQVAEAIHFYGSVASMGIGANVPPNYDVSTGVPLYATYGDGSVTQYGEEIPGEMLDGIAEDYALQAALMKELGYDMVFLHMCYRHTLLARFLSPLTNKRTDKFGGLLENRARFALMIADSIKKRCGKDFLIEASISGSEPYPGGQTLDDAIEYAKMFAGHIDLLQIRAGDIDPAHPTGFNSERTPFLYMAEAIKKKVSGIAVVTIGGYLDLDANEAVIASGKADFIGMARSWVSNPEYGRLAYEGRNEDVVPCIRCNKCHKSSYADPWTSVCSVNPTWGLEHRIEKMIEPARGKKKVAVVGGGPAGMEAALVASQRGHQVVLYEKSNALGGLLKTADNVPFKWPIKDFKNYLVRQIEKSNVKVYLNTEANVETLKRERYDAVLAAVGSRPIIPRITGIQGKNVIFAPDVYGKEDSLTKKVIIIGGGEVGVETGMHLAQKGHQVTVLEMGNMLAPTTTPVHYYSMFREAWEKLENFKYILLARCSSITDGTVTYLDQNNKEQVLEASNVVIAVGMEAKNDLALKLYGAGDQFFLIGDCHVAGNVQKTMRSAYSIASMI